MTEQPDTIDPVEFLCSSAIKWQMHARQTFMLIEALRNDLHNPVNKIEIAQAQEVHAMEHERAMMHYDNYLLMKGSK